MTQDQRRLRDSLDEILAQIGVFALAGPSIGAGVFSLIVLFLVSGPESNAPDPLPNLLPEYGYVLNRIAWVLFALVLAFPFSYLLAGLAAALTGLVVALARFWMLRSKWLFFTRSHRWRRFIRCQFLCCLSDN